MTPLRSSFGLKITPLELPQLLIFHGSKNEEEKLLGDLMRWYEFVTANRCLLQLECDLE